jgi:hypothetical protein
MDTFIILWSQFLRQESLLLFLCYSCTHSVDNWVLMRQGNKSQAVSSFWPTLRLEKGRWTFLRQEYWEIQGAIMHWKSDMNVLLSGAEKTHESWQYGETHLLHPFKDQPNAHACTMLPFLGLREIWRCFTLVRFMSLWPWECPWDSGPRKESFC